MSLLRTRAVTRRCANCNGSFVFIKHGERCAKCLEKAGDPQAERIAWLENQLYTMLSNFEDQMIEGQDIISDSIELEKENAKLKEKLSEFQNGLPIEKANKNKRYLTFDIYGVPRICSHIDLCWQYDVGDMIVPFDRDHRLYPLPSTETKEGE